MRIGGYFKSFKNINDRFRNKSLSEVGLIDMLKTNADLWNSLYFLLDHILLLGKLNAVKFDAQFLISVDFYSNLCWGVECLSTFICDVIEYFNLRREYKKTFEDSNKIENKESNGNLLNLTQ